MCFLAFFAILLFINSSELLKRGVMMILERFYPLVFAEDFATPKTEMHSVVKPVVVVKRLVYPFWSKENVVELLDENTGNVVTEMASPPKRALPSPPKRALEQAQFTSARFAAEKEDLEEQIRSLLLAKEEAEQQLEN